MKQPEIRTITEQQWETLRRETYNTINMILTGVETFLQNKHNSYGKADPEVLLIAGLLSHAVEEYGKLVYLKSLSVNNGNVDIEYNHDKFKNHNYKIKLAIDNLPSSCTLVKRGAFDPKAFQKSAFDTGIEADWQTRLDIFNTDLDDNGEVKKYPPVDFDTLKNAAIEFRKEVNKTTS